MTAPTVAWRAGAAPKNPTIRDGILNAVTTAAGHADCAGFDSMEIW